MNYTKTGCEKKQSLRKVRAIVCLLSIAFCSAVYSVAVAKNRTEAAAPFAFIVSYIPIISLVICGFLYGSSCVASEKLLSAKNYANLSGLFQWISFIIVALPVELSRKLPWGAWVFVLAMDLLLSIRCNVKFADCLSQSGVSLELSRKVQSLKHPKFFCWGCDF